MKFSILTSTYNSEKTVLDTVESVANQTYEDFEHIVVDSLSDDKTKDIVGQNGKNIKFYSEKDKGIYDAMNKGIEKSKGEIIGILNSDDYFYSKDVLEKVNDVFEKTDADIVYGNVIYIDSKDKDKIVRIWKTSKINKIKVWLGWMMPHPGIFVKREVYENLGKFNLGYKISADYDFILRIIKENKFKKVFLDKNLVKMRTRGISDGNILERLKMWQEGNLIFKSHFGIYPFWFFITRPLIKLKQFLIRG
jgi:glycosyltransferase involved in cell wall biosynthesis